MEIIDWFSGNYIEIAGALAGILYVFLEIRQNPMLWPVGIITSGAYIIVFFTEKLYADMSLQVYYVAISFLGWYWWIKGKSMRKSMGKSESEWECGSEKNMKVKGTLQVSRLKARTGFALAVISIAMFFVLWLALGRYTDSPVPAADSFITTLSVVATWMLARKIYEHWYLWIIVNFSMSALCIFRGLYPTLILYLVYAIMSFAGLKEWSKSLRGSEMK